MASDRACQMQSFIVGGYVRDSLLGLKPVDRDWVVVGATPHNLQEKGYQLVGKEFPVFIHPQSREVYALARTDRRGGQSWRSSRGPISRQAVAKPSAPAKTWAAIASSGVHQGGAQRLFHLKGTKRLGHRNKLLVFSF